MIVKNAIIQIISNIIHFKSLRKRFRLKYKSSIVKDNGKNNRLILLDDNANPINTTYMRNLEVTFLGDNNYVEMYVSTKFTKKVEITLVNSNYISIGKSPYEIGLALISPMKNVNLCIGDNFSACNVCIATHDEPGLEIEIGDDVMMSANITIRPSDGHAILDEDGNVLNYPQKIKIGNHCWIGMNNLILKGADIPDNSVLAAGSIYTKASNPKERALRGGVHLCGIACTGY